MIKAPRIYLRFGRRPVLMKELFNGVAFQSRAARRWHPAPLGCQFLPTVGGGPLLPTWRRDACFSFAFSSGEETSISPDLVSNLPPEGRPSLVFPLSTLPSSTDAWYSAGASILVSTGFAESSGRGAGHLIRSAFFIQPWKEMACSVSYHRIPDYEVFGRRVLTVVSGWLQSRPMSSVVSGHYFRFLKNNFHIPLCIVPKKC